MEQATVPAQTLTFEPDYKGETWLQIYPRQNEPATAPPREIRFGDALPDDVKICVGGHCTSLGWLREILKQV